MDINIDLVLSVLIFIFLDGRDTRGVASVRDEIISMNDTQNIEINASYK
jgi:hypothetical protein